MAEIKYKLIKNFFSEHELKVYQKYCYNKLDFIFLIITTREEL